MSSGVVYSKFNFESFHFENEFIATNKNYIAIKINLSCFYWQIFIKIYGSESGYFDSDSRVTLLEIDLLYTYTTLTLTYG